MAKMNIGYSPLSQKIYLGKQNEKKMMWVGEKRDITMDFLRVAIDYFKKGEVNTIRNSSGEVEVKIIVVGPGQKVVVDGKEWTGED